MSPWWTGAVIGVGLAVALWKAGAVTLDGAIAGAILLALMVALGGSPVSLGFALLVLLGTLASRWRHQRQTRSTPDTPPVRVGRNAKQALANAGLPALVLCCAPGLIDPDLAQVLALVGLGAALADTISGEAGIGLGVTPRLLLIGPVVAPGRDGAMSWQGTMFGMAAAALMASLAPFTKIGSSAAAAVFLGGVAGTLIDSLLGATVEQYLPKAYANDLVNLCSVSLAMTSVGMMSLQSLG